MKARPERVVVTGATGFIGAWLCNRLVADGHVVAGLARARASRGGLFEKLRLENSVVLWTRDEGFMAERLRDFAPDKVFNLAGASQVGSALHNPVTTYAANTAFVWDLLDVLRALEPAPAVVHASSETVYGPGSGTPFRESDSICPRGPYAASKAASEIVVRSFGESYAMPVVVARLGNVYGPSDRNSARLVPDLLSNLTAGRSPRLRDGQSSRRYLYVEDAIDALLLLAEHARADGVRGETFNVAGGESYTNLEVAHLVREACGRPDVNIIVGEGAVPTTQIASTDKIRKVLDWHPRIPLADGLRTIAKEMREAAPCD